MSRMSNKNTCNLDLLHIFSAHLRSDLDCVNVYLWSHFHHLKNLMPVSWKYSASILEV